MIHSVFGDTIRIALKDCTSLCSEMIIITGLIHINQAHRAQDERLTLSVIYVLFRRLFKPNYEE